MSYQGVMLPAEWFSAPGMAVGLGTMLNPAMWFDSTPSRLGGRYSFQRIYCLTSSSVTSVGIYLSAVFCADAMRGCGAWSDCEDSAMVGLRWGFALSSDSSAVEEADAGAEIGGEIDVRIASSRSSLEYFFTIRPKKLLPVSVSLAFSSSEGWKCPSG